MKSSASDKKTKTSLKFISKSISESNEKIEILNCDKCSPPRTFSSLTAYKSHMAKHANENYTKFTCGICNARFKWKHELNKHMTESGHQNKYICDTCDARFKRKKDKRMHMSQYGHKNIYTHACDTCDARFTFRTEKEKHMAELGHKIAGKNFTCDICESQFTLKRNLLYENPSVFI